MNYQLAVISIFDWALSVRFTCCLYYFLSTNKFHVTKTKLKGYNKLSKNSSHKLNITQNKLFFTNA